MIACAPFYLPSPPFLPKAVLLVLGVFVGSPGSPFLAPETSRGPAGTYADIKVAKADLNSGSLSPPPFGFAWLEGKAPGSMALANVLLAFSAFGPDTWRPPGGIPPFELDSSILDSVSRQGCSPDAPAGVSPVSDASLLDLRKLLCTCVFNASTRLGEAVQAAGTNPRLRDPALALLVDAFGDPRLSTGLVDVIEASFCLLLDAHGPSQFRGQMR